MFKGGGSVDAINFLLERGADPNSLGRFKRSPLYRAAFGGHLDVVQVCFVVTSIC